jgi:GTPase SAR1 family protein
MSDATLTAAEPLTPDSLHLVLFGLPSSGKSALLGALAQAAQTQEQVLAGKLSAPGDGLAVLQKTHYQGQGQPTNEEVVDYPITFEPFTGRRPSLREAVLVDCNGRVVSNLLSKPLERRPARGSLARKIRDADTLILVADGSADTAQLQRDFGQFAAFLRLFEQNRSERNEVAGLPVYLVLTKCDLLAKKTDTASAWMQKLEERKRQIDQSFHKYLAQMENREGLAFGKIDLQVWATAVGRPALADQPAKPLEPFGVAELFRQGLEAAADFHARRRRATRRLKITVGGIGGLAVFMLLLALGVYVTRPSADVAKLENSLSSIMPPEGAKPAERLKEPLDDKLAKLKKIRQNKFFSQLPAARQSQVNHVIEEMEAYVKYNKEFLDKVKDPRLARNDVDLADIEKSVSALAPPKDYAAAWKDTRVGRRPQLWRDDIAVLRKEIDKTITWINAQIPKAEKLEKRGFALLSMENIPPKEFQAWLSQYKESMEKEWPYSREKRLPGASDLTYETVYSFDRVEKTRRKSWEPYKKRLKEVRDRLREPS